MLLATVFAFTGVPRAYAGPLEDAGAAVLELLGLGGSPATDARLASSTTVDPSTVNGWRSWISSDGERSTTNNVGRVWTDKSVYDTDVTMTTGTETVTVPVGDDADFLVALSALSSYSNLSTTSTQPLDIVLMLDMSGSMSQNITSYSEVFQLDRSETYYILDGGRYYEAEWSSRYSSWRYRKGGSYVSVTPKESADDQTAGRVQLYERTRQTKISALRTAVKNFVDSTAEANDSIADPARRHHLSIAKFASATASDAVGSDKDQSGYQLTQRVTSLDAVTSVNKQDVIDAVNGVDPVGPTSAHSGMTLASRILSDGLPGDAPRANAKKVVIFFTDGVPTTYSDFDDDVANEAISTARTMKQGGVAIYSIGVFGGADPSDTTGDFNSYMNGLSSNYPDATAYTDLGTRVDAAEDYYYAAQDADELNSIFENIFTEIEKSTTGAPTHVESGDPTEDGYITFTDRLGSYMQVESFRKILFAGTEFDLKGDPTQDGQGNLVYTFTGTYDADAADPDTPYPSVDMEDVVITVTRSADIATGDVVTVKIPAANIPISKYKVEQDAEGNWQGEYRQTFPMVVFYGVKLKDGVDRLITEPDAAMQAYIAAHQRDGKVSFYSNAYDEASADGLTVARFTPSEVNNFNRFAEDTPLYEDAACIRPVAEGDFDPKNNTYYYKRTEYLIADDGTAAPNTLYRELKPSSDSVLTEGDGMYVAADEQGDMYIKAKSPRIQRVTSDIVNTKEDNATGTAETSNNPYWEKGQSGIYDTISIYLGNNGRLDVDIPGALSVTKTATVAEGSAGPVDAQGASTLDEQGFDLTVKIPAAAGQTFSARVVDAEGIEVSDPAMTVTLGIDGTYTQTLKNGESLQIFGLPAGSDYEMSETGTMPAGFSLKSVNGEVKAVATGSIVSGQMATAEFHNEYEASAADAIAPFNAQKVFANWDNVTDAAQFDIRLAAVDWPGKDAGSEPEFPEGSTVEQGATYKYVSHLVKKTDADRDDAFSFGRVSFDRVGTYVYEIGEYIPASVPAGVQFSRERYRVTVSVTDDGAGALHADWSITDQTQASQPELDKNAPVQIHNSYDLTEAQVVLRADKSYTDASGDNPLAADKFTFAVKPLTAGAPVPQYMNAQGIWTDYEVLDAAQGTYKATNHCDGSIELGTLRFDETKIQDGKPTEYVYELWEVPGSEVGMTYDLTHYFAHVTVQKDGSAVVGAVVYTDSAQTGGTQVDSVLFANSYRASAAEAVIEGTKTLSGRGMLEDETFGFSLTPDAATRDAIDAGSITYVGDALSSSVQDAAEGDPAEFAFGKLAFNRVGTYHFAMSETAWNGEVVPVDGTNGMKFDRHSCTVTVTVTRDAASGSLRADVAYSAAGTGNAFANSYTARGTAPAVTVSKTLTGRAMNPRDFSFAISPVDGAPAPDSQDASFSNTLRRADGQTEFMEGKLDDIEFDQADAGKTFDYTVSEVKPAGATDQDAAADGFQYQGVTYDEGVYTVRFAPTDNADGTMSVGVKVLDANGVELNETGRVDFRNAYAATGTLEGATELTGTKVINGDMPDKDLSGFIFKLEQIDAAGNVVDDPAVALPANASGATSGTDGAFAFGDIAFTRPGTYSFQATEVIPAEADRIPGLTYDERVIRFRVTVTDNGDGTLTAVKDAGAQPIAFTNVYVPEKAEGFAISVTKEVVGSDAAADMFSFRLVAADDETAAAVDAGYVTVPGADGDGMTASAGAIADGGTANVEFAGIAFSRAGDYSFTVTEDIPQDVPAGWAYDDHAATFEVKVTDSGAKLVAELASVTGSDVFTNTYGSTVPVDRPISTDGLFSKVLTGRDWREGDGFAFTIEPQDGAPAPAVTTVELTNRADGDGEGVAFGFGEIGFTFDDIKGVDQAPDGTRTKDFVYRVSENIPGDADKIPGITYDDHVATLTVTLMDDGHGTLSATSVVSDGTFTNAYATGEVDVDAAGGVQVVKTMTGRAISEGDFEFTMAPANDAAKAKFGQPRVVKTAAAPLGAGDASNVAVATTPVDCDLTFGIADAGETFAFEVSETKGGGAGYTNDETVHDLVFEVVDDGEGVLTVRAVLDGEVKATWTDDVSARAAAAAVSVPFANSYDAGSITVGGEGDVELTATKVLTGRPMVDGEFAFTVTDAVSGDLLATGANDASGAVSFTGIRYTTAKLNADAAAGTATVEPGEAGDVYTYTYVVSEDVSKNAAGVVPVVDSATIKVKVTDDGAGTLSAEVIYPEGGMVFENVYGASASAEVSLSGTKVLEVESGNNAPDITGAYTFTLSAPEGTPMPQTVSVSNDAAGKVSFGKVVYTMDSVFGTEGEQVDDASAAATSATREKTFVYTVSESGSVPGVVNDSTAKTIEVTVTDNGDGTLSARKSTSADAADFTFVNVYRVEPVTSSPTGKGGISVSKKLTGRDQRAGEFEFALASGGEGMPTVVTASNDAQGNVAFPEMAFTEPGVYAYTLAEVPGELGGVTYDLAVHAVTATVTDNGDGTLAVAWSADDDGKPIDKVVFANTYKAASTSWVINAAKVLTGRAIEEGEFSFTLSEGDEVLQTVTNAAPDEDGSAPIAFEAITFDEPGEHEFRIAEVKGDAEGVTYDETVFTYRVSVVDDGSGRLTATWTVGEPGAPVFRNAYVKPAVPEPEKPTEGLVQTGDGSLVGISIAAVAGMGALAVGIASRRKEK